VDYLPVEDPKLIHQVLAVRNETQPDLYYFEPRRIN